MKITCTKDNLLAGLNVVSRIASKNLTLPILGNVLLRTDQGGLVLVATNLEVGVMVRVRAKVETEGSITVQARLLSEFIALLETDKIELVTSELSLNVTSASSRTSIRGASSEEFPIIPEVAREHGFAVPLNDMSTALEQVLFSAAQDSSRPEISGVFMQIKKDQLTLAATDSYRLAERTLAMTGGADRSVIIPTRPLFEIVRIFGTEGDLNVYISESQALFVSGNIELTTRLIEGQYPDYRQIIPKTSTTQATLEIEAFTKLVRTASLFCKPGINDVTVEIGTDGEIACSAANAELGEHRGTLQAKVTGAKSSIVFNFRYLLDGLANLGSGSATLAVTDSASPGMLRPSPESDYLYLIMPIRQ